MITSAPSFGAGEQYLLDIARHLEEKGPCAIAEAMGRARPVEGKRTRGIPELIEDGSGSVIVEDCTPGQLAKGILFLPKNPQEAEALSTNARLMAEQRFSLAVMIDANEGVFGQATQ